MLDPDSGVRREVARRIGSEWLAQMAMDKDGKFLAMRYKWICNQGAYLTGAGPLINTITPKLTPVGVYRTPAVYGRHYLAMTNTTPTGPYRGAGRPDNAYLIDRRIRVKASGQRNVLHDRDALFLGDGDHAARDVVLALGGDVALDELDHGHRRHVAEAEAAIAIGIDLRGLRKVRRIRGGLRHQDLSELSESRPVPTPR